MKILKNNYTSLKVFLERRMFKIFLLGCISGFPWVNRFKLKFMA